MSTKRCIPAALAVLMAACAGNYSNPFASSNTTMAPPADAELVVASVASGGTAERRDLFALDESGSPATRLTSCDREGRPCDVTEASFAPDRNRVMARRRNQDTDSDGRLTAVDGDSLSFLDLTRGTEAVLVAGAQRVSGVDWSPAGNVVVYSALGAGGHEDLFVMDPNGQNNQNLTNTATVDERRPRIDPTGSVAVYERIEAGGKGRIFIYLDSIRQAPVTAGGEGTERLAGTPYVVGCDADPDYAPDGLAIVFRRLASAGNGGLGNWDIMSVKPDGTDLRVLASGPGFRGAPDWGTRGVVFVETDTATNTTRLVTLGPDGTRRVPVTQGLATGLQFPRWLP